LNILGTYKLVVDAIGGSLEFAIGPSLYPQLPHEAMNYFYFHRMGNIAIEGDYLIDDRYARAALHPDDNSVPPYPGWCSACNNFDLLGSWADAGDLGIYTVNHAISAWTLLNLHEMFPTAFVDGELNLPESENSFPDVLDEVDFGSRFVRGMLPSDGGLASHKAHNHAWSAFTITIAGENNENSAGTRSAMGSSTAATYAVARTNAQLARMWSKAGGDANHINTLWSAAKDAFNRAITNPVKYYSASEASPGPAVGGGDYPDGNVGDDFYAAACEMYLSAYTLSDENVENYKNYVTSSSYFKNMGGWDWASVAGAGTLSLYAVANDLDASDITSIEANIVNFADQIKMAIDNEGYPSNLNYPSEFGQYPWGSNSFIMNRMMVLAYAYEVTSDNIYQDYLLRSMDYVMGTNAMDISYVTGYGEKAETDTHDRWAWTVGEDTFWPKGWLSGGPNNELINDSATPNGVAAAKSYAAPGTAPNAWASKENTVNWNGPLGKQNLIFSNLHNLMT
jgi:endoglucanase